MNPKILTDQLDNKVGLLSTPQRIISIVPSQTELLYDLGLADRVVGITKFCVHPEEWHIAKTRVGGTKQLDIEKITRLQPDLIIANKEENDRAQIEELQQNFPVWISDITTLDHAISMISSIGEVTQTGDQARHITDKITINFETLRSFATEYGQVEVAYLIWRDPMMTVSSDTFIHDMLLKCGFVNAFGNGERYPEIGLQELRLSDPKLIMLSSEPYPFKQKHLAELQSECPKAKVMLVDGEMFSWYGSRLIHAATYFQRLIDSI